MAHFGTRWESKSFPKLVRGRRFLPLLNCFGLGRFRYWQVTLVARFRPFSFLRLLAIVLICAAPAAIVHAQGAKQTVPDNDIPDSDADHVKERNEWFFRGRVVHGKPTAELRRRAYQAKLRMRAQHRAALAMSGNSQGVSLSSGSWTPLGPMPLASDASGNGTQDYHQVAGRATAVAIDPADPKGDTVYIGGAQSGIWKSTNATTSPANNVTWTPVSDDQATLSIGAIAIQPGNNDPAKTVILAATGEANNSGDSYFGLGILRSTNAGVTWTLIPTADGGVLSFSGMGGTRMAFSSFTGQTNTVVSAMATTDEGVIEGAVTANTVRGLYTSLDAGQTWTYNPLVDPGGATDATSATSVVFNEGSGQFFAAVRYHGIYSSPDGTRWTRLAAQPGGALLSTAACPPQSTSNNGACPIYRAEITAVPGRNDIYVWFIYHSATGESVDGGIWRSANGGASWTQISDAAISNCGDFYGCGQRRKLFPGYLRHIGFDHSFLDRSIPSRGLLHLGHGDAPSGARRARTASLKLNSASFYSVKINATCDATALAGAMCALSPPNPIVIASGGTTNLTATINVPNNAIPGAYNIKIATQDTTGAPSHAFTVGVTLAQDFLVTSSTPSQSVTFGQTSGPYNLTVQPVGSTFSGAVTLACSSGLPAQAQCVFNPSTPVTPGNSAVNVVMNISTTASKRAFLSRLPGTLIFKTFYLLLPAVLIGAAGAGRRFAKLRLHGFASIAVLILVTLSLLSCGGVSNGGGTGPPPIGPQQVTYHVTVTGTSPGTAPDAGQSVEVLLVVN